MPPLMELGARYDLRKYQQVQIGNWLAAEIYENANKPCSKSNAEFKQRQSQPIFSVTPIKAIRRFSIFFGHHLLEQYFVFHNLYFDLFLYFVYQFNIVLMQAVTWWVCGWFNIATSIQFSGGHHSFYAQHQRPHSLASVFKIIAG